MVDIQEGTPARKASKSEEILTDFIGHLGLKWYIKTDDGTEISVEEYQRRKALEKKNLSTNDQGEILTSKGGKISDFPEEIQQIILDSLRQAEEEVEIPLQSLTTSCRPDIERKNLQSSYRKKIMSAIYAICRYALDGTTGTDLIKNPLNCLGGSRKPSKNNGEWLISAVFSYVKSATGKEWKQHADENEFMQAHNIALIKIEEVKEEMILRRQQYKKI